MAGMDIQVLHVGQPQAFSTSVVRAGSLHLLGCFVVGVLVGVALGSPYLSGLIPPPGAACVCGSAPLLPADLNGVADAGAASPGAAGVPSVAAASDTAAALVAAGCDVPRGLSWMRLPTGELCLTPARPQGRDSLDPTPGLGAETMGRVEQLEGEFQNGSSGGELRVSRDQAAVLPLFDEELQQGPAGAAANVTQAEERPSLGFKSPLLGLHRWVAGLLGVAPAGAEAGGELEDDVADGDWPWLEAPDRLWSIGPGPPRFQADSTSPEEEHGIEAVARRLLEAWAQSNMLRGTRGTNLSNSNFPLPPHLEDCVALSHMRRKLDERGENGSRPVWSLFGGTTALELGLSAEDAAPHVLLDEGEQSEQVLGPNASPSVLGPFPPWMRGADEDNLVLTRHVQRDLWLMQHPRDCSAPGVRFLVADLRLSNVYLGVGALLKVMAELLSEAVKMRRVLVFAYYVKADHDLCKGSRHASFSCYFLRETSEECYQRAMAVVNSGGAVDRSAPGAGEAEVMILGESGFLYDSPGPDLWGTPWEHIHPSVEVYGKLIDKTPVDSHRWFRAQALRYLMRYPSRRLCLLSNRARHNAFGRDAAVSIARVLVHQYERNVTGYSSSREPLRPFWDREEVFMGEGRVISMHVRQGDKVREMIMAPFSSHMALAEAVRQRFPSAGSVWLSTEMQSVIEETRNYKGWRFYFTNMTRQSTQDGPMRGYEHDIGMGLSSDNAYVNLMVAVSCDFFVGTMGSTWSVIIDDLRRTNGKEARGLLTE